MKLSKNFNKKKVIKIILFTTAIIIILSVSMFLFWWQRGTYIPNEQAITSIKSPISIEDKGSYIKISNEIFSSLPQVGLIFYPGARVDPRSYETLLSKLPENTNAEVFIVKFPLNLALLDVNAAESIISSNPNIPSWFIAGHSLGGAMISEYLKGTKNKSKIEGVIYMGAYPNDEFLKDKKYTVLSIYGSEDKLAVPEKIEATKSKLPSSSIFIELPSNHSQFGDYGHQEGDGLEILETNNVHDKIIQIVKEFMAQTR